ncbi:hypothetical protein RvVAT039_02760 [Agrobacterium vitis]|nr:hypothetical protein RvVAT039_02760 [Agrobacterium vitis]
MPDARNMEILEDPAEEFPKRDDVRSKDTRSKLLFAKISSVLLKFKPMVFRASDGFFDVIFRT